jgi:hypothetical protein
LYHDEYSVRPADRHASFTFDSVFGGSAGQEEIFNKTAKPLVDAALGGINVTIMTYGQVSAREALKRASDLVDPLGDAANGCQPRTLLKRGWSFSGSALCLCNCRLAPAKPSPWPALATTRASRLEWWRPSFAQSRRRPTRWSSPFESRTLRFTWRCDVVYPLACRPTAGCTPNRLLCMGRHAAIACNAAVMQRVPSRPYERLSVVSSAKVVS